MKGFIAEFKAFAIKGNVVDLAVAVIIGTAFGKIVTSLVNNLIMPLIGILLGGYDFSERAFTVGTETVTYGIFLQSVVDFIIIAFIVFIAVKILNNVHKKEEEENGKKPKEPNEEVKLLTEIRDSLRR